MTIREYVLDLLKECGCDETSYKGTTVEQAIEDAKWYENEYGKQPFSADEIGKELVLICNNERLEPLPPPRNLANDFDDWGSWGVGDMRNGGDDLRKAIESGEPFDSGWHGWKKELQSMRVQRVDSGEISVECYQEMDSALEQRDLFYDFLTGDEAERLDDEMVEEIRALLFEGDFVEEVSYDEDLPADATYEQVIETAKELMQDCDDTLKEAYHECISVTLYTMYQREMSEEELTDLINKRIEEN